MTTQSLGQLIRKMGVEGSDHGWDEFVGRFGRLLAIRVFRLLEVAGLTPLQEDVEDLVQEVYCRLLERRGPLRAFRGDTLPAVLAFLYRTVRSVICDHLRTALAAKRCGEGLAWRGAAARAPSLEECVADPDTSPERPILLAHGRRLLLQHLRQMAVCRRHRLILFLALIEGWSSREISESMAGELQPSSIDSVVFRARRRLKGEGIRLPRRSPRETVRRVETGRDSL